MKMEVFAHAALLAGAALGLAACGGGGGGGGTGTAVASPTPPTQPIVPVGGQLAVTGYSFTPRGSATTLTVTITDPDGNLGLPVGPSPFDGDETVQIQSAHFSQTLRPSEIIDGGPSGATWSVGLNTNDRVTFVVPNGYRYLGYGSHYTVPGPEMHQYFIAGATTPEANMPRTGTAHFAGVQQSGLPGNVTIDVNFGAATNQVTGKIETAFYPGVGAADLAFSAQISGAAFSGSGQFGPAGGARTGSGIVGGSFFGTAAEPAAEIGGYFQAPGWAGVFIAKR